MGSRRHNPRRPVSRSREYASKSLRPWVGSAFSAPHVTEWVTVDVTRTVKLLARMRGDKAFSDVRLSPLVLIMRAALAALAALARYPQANASWDSAAGEIVQYRDVNLGIATAMPRGLLVPNIRAAQTRTVRQLAQALENLVAEARSGKTQPERMKGGTFTITNVGVFGVDGATPILNPGEAAILCVGQIRRRPWEHKRKVALRDTLTLALSFDHRLIDGELASLVLSRIATVLEDPAFGVIE
jgi:2-oxoisovalerate dehydrogenase E2 component (dihydrolipoyl transacylase)